MSTDMEQRVSHTADRELQVSQEFYSNGVPSLKWIFVCFFSLHITFIIKFISFDKENYIYEEVAIVNYQQAIYFVY